MSSSKKFVIILENIRSIHNVGAFFRTADGAGFDHIYCCGFSPTPDDLRMNKVALGAENFISWNKEDSAQEVCKKLKAEGYIICALEKNASSENIFEVDISHQKIALIFGHEVDGITKELLSISDKILEIPMQGKKESLNVSVAGGIALYEIIRKKNWK